MKIAITGGIGSGKSYFSRLLASRGIDVYDCDAAAKRLMRTSEQLQDKLRRLVGEEVYSADGTLCKRVLAEYILASDTHKVAVNDIVHPVVATDFVESGYEWLESAILFDSGFDRRVAFDRVICVTAPLEVRIRRIVERDGISSEKAARWIDAQIPQEEVARRSDFVVINDGHIDLVHQVDECIRQINALRTKDNKIINNK